MRLTRPRLAVAVLMVCIALSTLFAVLLLQGSTSTLQAAIRSIFLAVMLVCGAGSTMIIYRHWWEPIDEGVVVRHRDQPPYAAYSVASHHTESMQGPVSMADYKTLNALPSIPQFLVRSPDGRCRWITCAPDQKPPAKGETWRRHHTPLA